MWEPLPLIVYGYAVHPLTPSRRDTHYSSRTTKDHRLSSVTEASNDDHLVNRDVVSLEVGDEVYAFEKYTPKGKEVDGIWYRGYVVCTTRRPPDTWALNGDSSKSTPKIEEPQQVFIGIFPASHIHIRDELSDAEGRLPTLASLNGANGFGGGSSVSSHTSVSSGELSLPWSQRSNGNMDPLREVDEDRITIASTSRKSSVFRLNPRPDQASLSRPGLPVYSTSLRSSSPNESQIIKPLPPRPSLKSGDDTASGTEQPIIDEIASALREWHILMFQYLARRDYRLFHLVREHIEALHLGRRQLLAKTLSAEETVNMRRDCVTRLVRGNLIQGLDVIVRHPTWGGLVTVDVEGPVDNRSWVSAVRMYAMQMALAYLNVPLDDTSPRSSNPSEIHPSIPLPTPAHSAFPENHRQHHYHNKSRSRSMDCFGQQTPQKQATAKFYHLFLDLRAFVASPCSPGETAELYFSLASYKKHEIQFITEDFCAVLNHNGVLARNPSKRIRTLFVDLTLSDVQEPLYLVCRIIRNGALKIGSSMSSVMPVDGGRRGSEPSVKFDAPHPIGYDNYGPVSPGSPRGATPIDGQFRRPFGCAVLELTQFNHMIAEGADVSSTKEHSMPIYVPTNETSFSMLHQSIIDGNTKEFEKSTRADMMAVSVKAFCGDAPTIVKENSSLLQGIPQTLRLGFPDVVFPGDVRNELYLKLWCGNFANVPGNPNRLSVSNFARGQMGSTSVNMQVSVEVRDQEGRAVESVITAGSGEPPVSQFNSMVFQRCNEPTFGELIKINLPPEGLHDWHLFFTFRNRTGKERTGPKETAEKPYAFSYLPLFPDKRAFVEDGGHTLVMYRADKLNQITADMYLNSSSWLVSGERPENVVVHQELGRLAPPLKDTMIIRTSLCSTRFTQNPVLLSLLNWEKVNDKEFLSTILSKFTFVGEVEIVKYLRDIFDSLFGILVSSNNQSGEMDLLVFNALVTVLGIIQDRRFSNFRPVLDLYVDKHFSYAAASSHLIHSMNRLVANPADNETASQLRASLKVWHYIIKFIARSRELQKIKEAGVGADATAEHLDASFKRELRAHLAEITRMMSMNAPTVIGTQTIALQNFTSILPELAKIFSTVDLVSIVTTFATNAVAVGKGKIVIWKLIMYLHIVKGFLFDNPQSRPLLVEAVVLWIKPHFGRYDEYTQAQSSDSETAKDTARLSWLENIRLCITIIAVMLDKLQQSLISPEIVQDRRRFRTEQDNVECLLPLLPRILDSYREFMNPTTQQTLERTFGNVVKTAAPTAFPESYPFSLLAYLPDSLKNTVGSREPERFFNPGLSETAVVFLVLVLSSSTKHILEFLESSLDIEGRERFVNLLSHFFKVSTSILGNDAFPKTWLNINILAHKVLVKMMDPVSSLLIKKFIPPQELESQFDSQLWREAFYMLLKLLSSEQLVIEEFSPQKRRAVWRLAGDIRGEGAAVMLNLWQSLGWAEHASSTGDLSARYGGYQVHLSSLVGPVVNLCLSHHEQLRNNAVQMLYSMIVSEFHQSGHFEEIENVLVTRLDSLFMAESKADDISGAFFVGQLRHLFDNSDVDEQLRERVSNFLDSVDLFLELLLSVRALPEGEEFADERVIATLRLMNFIRRIGRDEIYIKYVHQLVNMHLQSNNYVEAALTLKLHSDLYSWDLDVFVPPMDDLGLPQQSQFHRKETLCLLILDYLGRGKAWERAIDICKEIASQHSEVTFNYGRLSEILRHQAILLEHIVTEQRYYSDYYLVTFYGNFPVAIRDKRFIYRGYEWEKYGAFCERMLNKHPGARLLKMVGDPPVDIRFGSDQYIQCTAVTPEPNRESPVFTNADVPISVRTYYEHSAINLFSTSRQVKRSAPDGTEETWLEKAYFTTEETFPTVLRRSQVVGLEVVEISPVENALSEVEQKTKDLNGLHMRYRALANTAQDVSTNALAMVLNTAVDTPANTGIPAYRRTFFTPDYVSRYPDRAELVDKLRIAVDDQVRVLDMCLKLHGQLCPTEFLPFHETLEKFFRKNFKDEIRRLGLEDGSDTVTISPSIMSGGVSQRSQYQTLLYDAHTVNTSASTASIRRVLAPLQMNHRGAQDSAPPLSPQSPTNPESQNSLVKQTPLQRHLAHLTRHGINGVSSAPNDTQNGSDTLSAESMHASFVNVGTTLQDVMHPAAATSGASVATGPGSLASFGSLKGRFSRLGSLNFGRRNNNTS
ncbi:cytoplasmic protein [Dendrothele bispora CBS 962.96]|uniref:Cytoplasmic protein n=1 Tax=Dendrothele bispora (strain CBS 962.96) TaxID=1314807 RepID=A0A4S8MUB9_DENBC|nr:cytoplasmic protein [Dendrothele bispora CBS 962.96]